MNSRYSDIKLSPPELSLYLFTTALGVALGEIYTIGSLLGDTFYNYASNIGDALPSVYLFINLTLIIVYFLLRQGPLYASKVIRSKRIDLLLLLILGVFFSISTSGIGSDLYLKNINKLTQSQQIIFTLLPSILLFISLFKNAITYLFSIIIKRINRIRNKDIENDPIFINDQEIMTSDEDLLGIKQEAYKFSYYVLNRGSSDSLIFGIDSPWGIGKTSFVNLCIEYWKDEKIINPIIYKFEPLRYSENSDLSDHFISDFISTIQKYEFTPELKTLLLHYNSIVRNKNFLSWLGLTTPFTIEPKTAQDTLDDLSDIIEGMDRKIIVIVDDLDRINWDAVKSILFSIKRSFRLPNVTFVLCYDTENFYSSNSSDYNLDYINEFLEKFINIKKSLFLNTNAFTTYLSENLKNAIENNLAVNERVVDKSHSIIDGLINIIKSKDYYDYKKYISDVRKIKRIINSVFLFKLDHDEYKFTSRGINTSDLIHLILLYVNFPNVFRTVYHYETGGHCGHFSLIEDTDQYGTKYSNSSFFTDYIKEIDSDAAFLLKKLFDIEALDFISDEKVTNNTDLYERACFNNCHDQTRRNLDRYLNVIINLADDPPTNYYIYFVNKAKDIISGNNFDEVVKDKSFNTENGDAPWFYLWRAISNTSHQIDRQSSLSLVTIIVNTIQTYSIVEHDNIAHRTRATIVYSLLKILNNTRWVNKSNQNNDNLLYINHIIYGLQEHNNIGVINNLSDRDRGVLGLHDLLLFRLNCCPNRQGNLANIYSALSIHLPESNKQERDLNKLTISSLRELSQCIFSHIEREYINKQLNIFELIYNLTTPDLFCQFESHVKKLINKKIINNHDLEALESKTKNGVMSFITHQISNKEINYGIGLGYYDKSGAGDGNTIFLKINEYLFDTCFNPEITKHNYHYFILLLISRCEINHDYFDDSITVKPRESDFMVIFNSELLINYWNTNREKIIEFCQDYQSEIYYSYNYTIQYSEILNDIFDVLDNISK